MYASQPERDVPTKIDVSGKPVSGSTETIAVKGVAQPATTPPVTGTAARTPEGQSRKVKHSATTAGVQPIDDSKEEVSGRTSPRSGPRAALAEGAGAVIPKSMHALVWRGKHDIRYEEVPTPVIKDPHNAIIRVTATSICGSDLHFYNKYVTGMKSGDVVGHEFMGIVAEVGGAVSKVKVGQRVVAAFDMACGTCEFCVRQEYTACQSTNSSHDMDEKYGQKSAGLFGYSHLTGGFAGGQAEFVRVPFADMNLLPIPDDVPDEKALFLSDIVPTAFHALELCEFKEGDVIGVWGLGPVGLLVCRWAQLFGARKVVGISGTDDRLRIAKEQLGIEVINYHKEDVKKRVRELFPAGLDCAVDAAAGRYARGFRDKVEQAVGIENDTSEIIDEAVYCLRQWGRLGIIQIM